LNNRLKEKLIDEMYKCKYVNFDVRQTVDELEHLIDEEINKSYQLGAHDGYQNCKEDIKERQDIRDIENGILIKINRIAKQRM
jgi:hypothetical protein